MPATYLRTLLSTFLLALLAVSGINGYRYFVLRDLHDDPRLGQLLRYQEQKLRAEGQLAETVLLGDSALGNAIDAALFSELTGTRTISLALTGTFHYGSAYLQLRTLAGQPNRIRSVVLMYAVDAPASGRSLEGVFFMSADPLVPELGLAANLLLVRNYLKRLLDGPAAAGFLARVFRSEFAFDLPPALAQYDYLVSHARIPLQDQGYRLPLQAAPTADGFLPLIKTLCEREQWRCVYAHGPLLDYARQLAPAATDQYLASVVAEFDRHGLPLASVMPLLLKPSERGDTFFHVHPDARTTTTRWYATLLLPWLAAPNLKPVPPAH